jgi:hypothetical protein
VSHISWGVIVEEYHYLSRSCHPMLSSNVGDCVDIDISNNLIRDSGRTDDSQYYLQVIIADLMNMNYYEDLETPHFPTHFLTRIVHSLTGNM